MLNLCTWVGWIVLAREEINKNIGHRYGYGKKKSRSRNKLASVQWDCAVEKLHFGADWKITSCHTSKFHGWWFNLNILFLRKKDLVWLADI